MLSVSNFTLNIIKDFKLLNFLYPEWLQLYKRSRNASPFVSPDWLLPWWQHFGGNHQLNVLEVRYNKHLCGLAPFHISFNSETDKKELKFIGTGNSDYLDVLIEDDMTESCMNMIFNFLVKNETKCEHYYLQGLQSNSPFLTSVFPDELEMQIVNTDVCPVIYLTDFNDSIDRLLSKGFLKYLDKTKRILSEAGILELETADAKNINIYLTKLFIMHKDRWGLKDKPSIFSENKLQAFHHEAVHNLISNQSVKLYRLLHNNTTVAMLYILVKDKTMYNYIGAFNPDYKKYSPGSILMLAVLEECFDKGINEFNMLTGAEDYKYRWGAEDKPNYTILIKHR